MESSPITGISFRDIIIKHLRSARTITLSRNKANWDHILLGKFHNPKLWRRFEKENGVKRLIKFSNKTLLKDEASHTSELVCYSIQGLGILTLLYSNGLPSNYWFICDRTHSGNKEIVKRINYLVNDIDKLKTSFVDALDRFKNIYSDAEKTVHHG